jgi:methionine synthase II (cobalamin-independent)
MRPYHTDVVGSLLRPASLLAARTQVERGELTAAAFKHRHFPL